MDAESGCWRFSLETKIDSYGERMRCSAYDVPSSSFFSFGWKHVSLMHKKTVNRELLFSSHPERKKEERASGLSAFLSGRVAIV